MIDPGGNQDFKMSGQAEHGGAREGAGRKPGSKNQRTIEREQAAAELAEKLSEALGVEAFEGDALSLMQLLYKHPGVPFDLRFEAAKVAAPFERPKLAAVEQTPPGTFQRHEDALAELERLAGQNVESDATGAGAPGAAP